MSFPEHQSGVLLNVDIWLQFCVSPVLFHAQNSAVERRQWSWTNTDKGLKKKSVKGLSHSFNLLGSVPSNIYADIGVCD